MPHVITPQAYECVVESTAAEARFINVVHLVRTPDALPLNIADIAASFRASWANRIQPLISSGVNLIGVKCTDLGEENGAQATTTAPPVPGGNVSEAAAWHTAALVKKKTGKSGRSFTGRMFIAGLTEGQITGGFGLLATGVQTAWQNALNGMLADIKAMGTNNDISMAVVSQYKGVDANGRPIRRAVGLTTIVTALLMDPKVATQRERLGR